MGWSSFEAPDSEIVKDTGHLLCRLELKVSDRVYPVLGCIEVVCGPSLEVIDVLLAAHLDDQVTLLPVHFVEDLVEGEPDLISVVMVEFIHVEGKVGQHLVVELVEVAILLGILAVDLPKHITEHHKHASFIQHALDFSVGFLAGEEVQGLSHRYQVVFLPLIDRCNAILLQNYLVLRVPSFELIDFSLGYSEHL